MRLVILILRVAALTTAIWALASRASCAFVTNTCLGTNLFSYFTVHSIFLLILALLLSTCYTVFTGSEPGWLTAFRALATTYVMVSGIVFALLLSNAALFNYLFLVPMSSKVLHFVLPVYAVADFLLSPRRHRLKWSTAWLAMIFPALWAVYTLVRGELVGWYPYFFLNPSKVGGYQVVGMYALGLSGFILLIAFVAVAMTRLPSTPAELGKKGQVTTKGQVTMESSSPRSRTPEKSMTGGQLQMRH